MKERGNQPPPPEQQEPEDRPLTVDEVYELIYENEANENRYERLRRDDELYELLSYAEELEAKENEE